ncbi:MAG: hypothetical protein M0P31_04590 [Solirubrobacteraceae bacterium]|nr:hypothetical protein [Solirubrobacteraceae bacterium]
MPRLRTHLRTLLLVVAVAVVPAATVPGAASAQVSRDCASGSIPKGKYTAAELQDALDKLDGGLADYSDCADNIYRALQDAAASGGGGDGGSGGSAGSGGSVGGSPSDAGATTATPSPDPVVGADDAAPDEVSRASDEARKITETTPDAPVLRLGDDEIPADALALGATGQSIPTSLLLALIAVAGAAVVAGLSAMIQTVRRRRGG